MSGVPSRHKAIVPDVKKYAEVVIKVFGTWLILLNF